MSKSPVPSNQGDNMNDLIQWWSELDTMSRGLMGVSAGAAIGSVFVALMMRLRPVSERPKPTAVHASIARAQARLDEYLQRRREEVQKRVLAEPMTSDLCRAISDCKYPPPRVAFNGARLCPNCRKQVEVLAVPGTSNWWVASCECGWLWGY